MWPFKRKCPVCQSRVTETKRDYGVLETKTQVCGCGSEYTKKDYAKGTWRKTCVDVKIAEMTDLLVDQMLARIVALESAAVTPEEAAKMVARILARDAKVAKRGRVNG